MEKAKPTQYGGINRRGPDLSAMMATVWWQILESHGWSGGHIYVDVISAFDSVVRSLVLPTPPLTDELVVSSCAKMRLPSETFSRLCRLLESECVASKLGVEAGVSHLLAESHMNTWFSTQGLTDVVSTPVGARPGDPLGDEVFHFLAWEVFQHRAAAQACPSGQPLVCSASPALFPQQ